MAAKRMGRPPREPGGPATFHLGLRLNDHRRDQLLRLVEMANDRAREASVPANVTPSSLVAMWIFERLDEETAKLGKKR
jgi:hypothetical protein